MGHNAGIIALSYEAKAAGVKRGMFMQEAERICPGIIFVGIPTKFGKADTSFYKAAGSEVMELLGRYGEVERVSIDEAYLDMTESSEEGFDQWLETQLAEMSDQTGLEERAKSQISPATFRALCAKLMNDLNFFRKALDKTVLKDKLTVHGVPYFHERQLPQNLRGIPRAQEKETEQREADRCSTTPWDFINEEHNDVTHLLCLLRSCYKFVNSTRLCFDIVQECSNKIHLSCSLGVSVTKCVSKIASSKHKPNKISLIFPLGITTFLSSLSVRDLRGYGQKLGKDIIAKTHCTTVGEILGKNEKFLVNRLGNDCSKTVGHLVDACHGIDDCPVAGRLLNKSVGCSKRWVKPQYLFSQNLQGWITSLMADLTQKMESEKKDNHRQAQQVVVHWRTPQAENNSKCIAVALFTREHIESVILKEKGPFLNLGFTAQKWLDTNAADTKGANKAPKANKTKPGGPVETGVSLLDARKSLSKKADEKIEGAKTDQPSSSTSKVAESRKNTGKASVLMRKEQSNDHEVPRESNSDEAVNPMDESVIFLGDEMDGSDEVYVPDLERQLSSPLSAGEVDEKFVEIFGGGDSFATKQMLTKDRVDQNVDAQGDCGELKKQDIAAVDEVLGGNLKIDDGVDGLLTDKKTGSVYVGRQVLEQENYLMIRSQDSVDHAQPGGNIVGFRDLLDMTSPELRMEQLEKRHAACEEEFRARIKEGGNTPTFLAEYQKGELEKEIAYNEAAAKEPVPKKSREIETANEAGWSVKGPSLARKLRRNGSRSTSVKHFFAARSSSSGAGSSSSRLEGTGRSRVVGPEKTTSRNGARPAARREDPSSSPDAIAETSQESDNNTTTILDGAGNKRKLRRFSDIKMNPRAGVCPIASQKTLREHSGLFNALSQPDERDLPAFFDDSKKVDHRRKKSKSKLNIVRTSKSAMPSPNLEALSSPNLEAIPEFTVVAKAPSERENLFSLHDPASKKSNRTTRGTARILEAASSSDGASSSSSAQMSTAIIPSLILDQTKRSSKAKGKKLALAKSNDIKGKVRNAGVEQPAGEGIHSSRTDENQIRARSKEKVDTSKNRVSTTVSRQPPPEQALKKRKATEPENAMKKVRKKQPPAIAAAFEKYYEEESQKNGLVELSDSD